MKNFLLSTTILLLMVSCNNEENTVTDSPEANAIAHRGCASHDVLDRQLKEDPTLSGRMAEIELKTKNAITQGRIVNGVLEIPVVFNVLYRTSSENISDAQLQSQIDVLNKDFNAQNSDFNTANNPYSDVRANVGIRFVLDAVNRKSTNKSSWGTRDVMKKSKRGGIDPTSPTTKLNIWVCTIGGGILGYAQFPGGSSATDGVVLDSKYTGTTGTATYPFNLGRTATHEVGHWMNLRHIWGDTTCGNDLVNDTPTHNTANYGVPAVGHRSTCSGTPLEMYMNYMDYTDDRGMYMFSNDQKDRMLAVFSPSGPRASFR
ncbi:peptidase M43 [Flavobacterium sp. 316]|uniref:Zinc metalloprotease n=1 Tax=Flavobacterium sediminilitoris TaxID=2024526 RepID=A0ABY4HJ45_9FLAO|nr:MULTISPECIES: zinc metalloprotease [Flavobacterium]KIX20385.1 peptidase M43 [Flavobacterium sp. 316]UOX32861.1 zinc metalloprotease [Flavobacterium sediminilitoris]